ncbi:MAG: hypothetical protein K0R65_240 [Crocinitomicaceae bacterium]|jgi:predicted nucleotidyltransferase|nr:hypothetical protein [Crocinitomicaceae bacterium]
MIALIENNIPEIISLCKKHQVKALSLFGSAAKNTMTAQSDLDFLVQFSDDLAVLDYADNYFAFLEALEKITGKSIDLISAKSLKNPILKENIYSSKVDLYAA